MNISIFGLGYVGCVSLGCLAQNGHRVIGVDINKDKVNMINKGKPTVLENELETIIEENFKRNRVTATTDHHRAVIESDVSIMRLAHHIRLPRGRCQQGDRAPPGFGRKTHHVVGEIWRCETCKGGSEQSFGHCAGNSDKEIGNGS